MNPRNPILPILFLAFSFSIASAQGTRLLRQPAISDTHIVFVYANDLWAVEEALRLLETEGVELQAEPDPPVRYRRPDPRQ